MANSSEKISLYNLSDLKTTTDDAIPNYLNSLKFKQSHYLTNVRLALGYGAFLISAACFAWDYKFGFENTKLFTGGAVGAYTAVNGALTFWMAFVEKGVVYQGEAPSGEKITITSATKKNDPTYNLKVTITDKEGRTETDVSGPFSTFFDESGYFVAAPFQQILATSVPLIGRRDPKRIKSQSQELLNANPELLDAVLSASTTSAEPTGKAGEKRRKA